MSLVRHRTPRPAARAGLAGLLVAALTVWAVGWGPEAAAATKPKLRVYDATITEGTFGQVVLAFAVRLSKPASKPVTFEWRTKAGTASAADGDFVAVPAGTQKTIRRGATSVVVLVRVAADEIDEYTESFGVRITDAPGAVEVVDDRATATILDDDRAPRLQVVTPDVVEGTDTAPVERKVSVTLSAPSEKPISVRYKLAGGTATLGGDLAKGKGEVRFKPGGKLTKKVPVELTADSVDEPNETFGITWSEPDNVRAADSSPMTLLDDDGPTTPEILGTTPGGPNPDASPRVFGLAPAESTVQVFRTSSCTGPVIASGPATDFAGAGLVVPMDVNETNTLSVRGTDTAGGDDTACSAPFDYRHDDVAPAAPTVTIVGGSPTTDTTPSVRGVAETGSSVEVFLDTSCAGTAVAAGTAADYGSAAGLDLGPVTPNRTLEVRARATDQAGNVGPCSAPVDLFVDTVAPDAPTGLERVGNSPTTNPTPRFRGDAEAGSTVILYRDTVAAGGCNDVVATGSAADFGNGNGLQVSSPLPDGTSVIRATATDAVGRVSACSTESVTVVVDTQAPDAPADLELVDETPTTDETPRVRGTAEAGSTVTVYQDTAAAGPCNVAVASVSATNFADPNGVVVDPLGHGTHVLRAVAADELGQASPCSSSSVTVEVDLQVADPQGLQVVGVNPTNNTTRVGVRGAVDADVVTVRVYRGANCGNEVGTGTAAQFESGQGIAVTLPDQDATYALRAVAEDALGNLSGCSTDSVDVTVDVTAGAPTGLVLVGPDPSDNTPPPAVRGSVQPDVVAVQVYRGADCATQVGSGSAAAFESAGGIDVTLDDGTYTLRAIAEDALGNRSPCSASSVQVTVDTAAPAITDFDVSGPTVTDDATPELTGSLSEAATLRVFDGDCSGPALDSVSRPSGAFSFDVSPPLLDGDYELRIQATDPAGNEGACEGPIALTVDTTPPNEPNALALDVTSPTNATSVRLTGSAPDGTDITVYGGPVGCTNPVGSGTAAQLEGAGIELALDEGSYVLRAIATDQFDRDSACSDEALSLVVDRTDPVINGFARVGPAATTDPTPGVTGSVVEPLTATVRVYAGTGCGGQLVGTVNANAFESGTYELDTPLALGPHELHAQATDAAGNVGTCVGPVSVEIVP